MLRRGNWRVRVAFGFGLRVFLAFGVRAWHCGRWKWYGSKQREREVWVEVGGFELISGSPNAIVAVCAHVTVSVCGRLPKTPKSPACDSRVASRLPNYGDLHLALLDEIYNERLCNYNLRSSHSRPPPSPPFMRALVLLLFFFMFACLACNREFLTQLGLSHHKSRWCRKRAGFLTNNLKRHHKTFKTLAIKEKRRIRWGKSIETRVEEEEGPPGQNDTQVSKPAYIRIFTNSRCFSFVRVC